MKKNIFIKSMLRQPVRTALLMLLIALAAGAFIMRGVEYRVIRSTFDELGGRYVAVGFIRPLMPGNIWLADVEAAADIISGSEFIWLEDRRRTVEGVMHGIHNAYIEGWRIAGGGISPLAFFYGELLEIRMTGEYNALLSVAVDEVLAGYPEHVVAGQTVTIRHFASPRTLEAGPNPVDSLRVGERYLLRAVFPDTTRGFQLPREGYDDWLYLRPLNYRRAPTLDPPPGRDYLRQADFIGDHFYYHDLPQPIVWYMPAPAGVSIDYMEIDWLAREILFLRHSQASLNLQTTLDMEYIPHMRPPYSMIVLEEGRLINLEDNELQNHVIVIHRDFAARRGLELGDSITFSIPHRQVVLGAAAGTSMIVRGEIIDIRLPHIGSKPSEILQTLELEIVGIYAFNDDRRHQLWNSRAAYIPDTILTDGVDLYNHWINWIFFENLPDPWYSFVLYDPLDRAAFLGRYADLLMQMGYILSVPETGAENFHATAAPVTQAITFNLIVFGMVTLMVFALVVWLFLRQRRRDFAIMRALGCSAGNAFGRLAAALAVFGIPSVAIGGAVAWVIARWQIQNTLHPFEEIVYGFEPVASPGIYLLPILMAAVLAGLFVLFVIFSRVFSKPVLELLRK